MSQRNPEWLSWSGQLHSWKGGPSSTECTSAPPLSSNKLRNKHNFNHAPHFLMCGGKHDSTKEDLVCLQYLSVQIRFHKKSRWTVYSYFYLLIPHRLTTSSSSCFRHTPPGGLICLFPVPLLPLLNDDLPSRRTAPLYSATPHRPHPPVSTPGPLLCVHNSFLRLLQHPALASTLSNLTDTYPQQRRTVIQKIVTREDVHDHLRRGSPSTLSGSSLSFLCMLHSHAAFAALGWHISEP